MDMMALAAERTRLQLALESLVDSCTDGKRRLDGSYTKTKAPKKAIVDRARSVLKELSQ